MVRLTRSQLVDYAYVLLAFFIGDQLFVESHMPNRKGGSYKDQIHSLVWRSWDLLFRVAARIKHLEKGESHLFCITQRRHLGRPFAVDGVCVRRFDPVIEIHMNNKFLAQVMREQDSVVSLAARLVKEARRSLPALANCVAAQKYQKVKILYGTTLIHRGVERFGFSTHPIQSPTTRRFLAWYLCNILRMANPNAYVLSKSQPDIFNPKIVAISKQRLIQAYGGNRAAELRTAAEMSPC
jgi:hypothetical protein